MTTSSRSLAVAVALSLALPLPFVPVARAAPSAADMESARQLFNEGKDLREKGDLVGARDKFRAAHALGQTPITGIELGKTHMLLGELVEAREAFLSVGRIPVASDETKKSADARVECDKLAGDLKARIPAVKIILVGVPAGASARVTVDGEEIPSAALGERRSVNPGHHVLIARVGSGPEAKAEIDLKESETRDVTLVVDAGAKPASATPPSGPTIPPTANNNTFTAKPGVDEPSHTSPLVYVGFGLAAVGVIAGGITGAMALGKASDVKTECPNSTCASDKKALLDDTKTFANISTISFAVAGGGVVLGIIGLMKKSPSDQAGIRPYLGVGSVGLTGAF